MSLTVGSGRERRAPGDRRFPSATPRAPWGRPFAEVADALQVDPDIGLAEPEVRARRQAAGPNDLPVERSRSLIRSVAAQLGDTVVLVLLGAAALTATTGDLADCAVILLVIAVNTIVGVVQERRAIGAIAALRAAAAPTVRVRRDRRVLRVPTRDLVVGDVLVLAEGDVVGADARLGSAHALQVDEALLTGESQPSERAVAAQRTADPETLPIADRVSMVHAGTLVTHGSGTAVVVATGVDTCMGAVASLLHRHPAPPTPLQLRLAVLGRRLSAAVVAACAVVVATGLAQGGDWRLVAVSGVSLAVAAIPESLPAVVALALAAAARRMAARGAIIRSLPAAEALGSVTVLATDKTGTLTTGRITCTAVWTPAGGEWEIGGGTGPAPADVRAVLEAVVLCSDAAPGAQGTEGALLDAAQRIGMDVEQVRCRSPRTDVVPFDAAHRTMTTRHVDADARPFEVVKGAPEVLGDIDATGTAVLDRWTGAGRRVLAVATGPPGAVRVIGLVALVDPVRADARETIAAIRAAGITPIMITGDHAGTANAVAREVGIGEPDRELRQGLHAVYARTDPGSKLDIVTSWRDTGAVVAMTGDGVNDAPALRAADVGVAMGRRGTEVAKAAADVVLTDDSLVTLVAAVEEGRRVFDNIRRFVRYAVAGGLAELLLMLIGPLVGMALPLLPGQILWVNLATHGLPGVAIGSEAAEPDVLHRPPRDPSTGVLDGRVAGEIAVLGGLVAGCCLALGLWARRAGLPWQTMVFVTLALAQLGIALTTRSDTVPAWRVPIRANLPLHGAIATSLAGLAAALYLPALAGLLSTRPLGLLELSICLAVAAVPPSVAASVIAARARRPRMVTVVARPDA
ncbi:cation-translocating P-type ATPase [Pseudonocardia sp. CA-107938]|uniref:cation-translocating P-type ATPase n=1 Tax=Pseudonocardia sp. CA-107938 TaxID=3240021 RepID=UPI003D8E56A8